MQETQTPSPTPAADAFKLAYDQAKSRGYSDARARDEAYDAAAAAAAANA